MHRVYVFAPMEKCWNCNDLNNRKARLVLANCREQQLKNVRVWEGLCERSFSQGDRLDFYLPAEVSAQAGYTLCHKKVEKKFLQSGKSCCDLKTQPTLADPLELFAFCFMPIPFSFGVLKRASQSSLHQAPRAYESHVRVTCFQLLPAFSFEL